MANISNLKSSADAALHTLKDKPGHVVDLSAELRNTLKQLAAKIDEIDAPFGMHASDMRTRQIAINPR